MNIFTTGLGLQELDCSFFQILQQNYIVFADLIVHFSLKIILSLQMARTHPEGLTVKLVRYQADQLHRFLVSICSLEFFLGFVESVRWLGHICSTLRPEPENGQELDISYRWRAKIGGIFTHLLKHFGILVSIWNGTDSLARPKHREPWDIEVKGRLLEHYLF